jgi:hypothetical protein
MDLAIADDSVIKHFGSAGAPMNCAGLTAWAISAKLANVRLKVAAWAC